MLMMDKLMNQQIIIPKVIDSNEELEKELQEGSESGNRDQRRQEPNLELKHSLIGKQNMPGFMNKEGKCSAEPA